MSEVNHETLMNYALNANLTVDKSAEVAAMGALYHLLNERLPQAPMQVIPTPEPEVEGGVQMNFHDISDSMRYLAVTPRTTGEFELYIASENGGYKSIRLSGNNARTLARSILATKSLTQD